MEREMKLNSDIQRFTGIWVSVADPPHFDADPDPACHLDPDPSFPLKWCSNMLIFHTFWLFICKLMRIRIQLITLMRMQIQILLITLKRIWIQPFNLMRI